jgi:ATP-dependent exoDNAse (exonuclease V) beta subunit
VGSSINPVPFLIPPDMLSTGQPVFPKDKTHGLPARRYLPATPYQPWITRLQEEFLRETASQSQARFQGEMLHFCLSRIGNLTGANQEGVIKEALRQTFLRFGQAPEGKCINALLNTPSWKKFFHLPPGTDILCEQEIVNTFGDTRRLDRLIVFPKEVWVVDFKTSAVEGQDHARQIEEYKTLLAKIYPGRAITGHLLYLDGQ